jgi:hypothetical protein
VKETPAQRVKFAEDFKSPMEVSMKLPTADCAESRSHLTRLPGLADPVGHSDFDEGEHAHERTQG